MLLKDIVLTQPMYIIAMVAGKGPINIVPMDPHHFQSTSDQDEAWCEKKH